MLIKLLESWEGESTTTVFFIVFLCSRQSSIDLRRLRWLVYGLTNKSSVSFCKQKISSVLCFPGARYCPVCFSGRATFSFLSFVHKQTKFRTHYILKRIWNSKEQRCQRKNLCLRKKVCMVSYTIFLARLNNVSYLHRQLTKTIRALIVTINYLLPVHPVFFL